MQAIHQYDDVIAVVRLALMQYAIFVTHLSVVEWTKKPGSHCHDHAYGFIWTVSSDAGTSCEGSSC